MSQVHHHTIDQKRHLRIRAKISGTDLRPRLSVYRSNKHIKLQVIDDVKRVTLAAADDLKLKGTKTEKSVATTQELIKILKKKKINQLVFDRGVYRYHGRVKAVAETLRAEGLEV